MPTTERRPSERLQVLEAVMRRMPEGKVVSIAPCNDVADAILTLLDDLRERIAALMRDPSVVEGGTPDLRIFARDVLGACAAAVDRMDLLAPEGRPS